MKTEWHARLCLALWPLCAAVTAPGQGLVRVESHVFSAGYSPPAVGSATVQANVVVAQDGLTGGQHYGSGDHVALGFLAALPHRDSDADGLADPDDSDSDGDGNPDTVDNTPYDADDDGLNNLNDPDDDNDGQSDLDEGVAGTNPLDPASRFRIAAIDTLPGGDVRLVWDGVPPRSYTIYTAADLSLASPWTLAANTNAATTGPILFTLPGTASNGFFRLGGTR